MADGVTGADSLMSMLPADMFSAPDVGDSSAEHDSGASDPGGDAESFDVGDAAAEAEPQQEAAAVEEPQPEPEQPATEEQPPAQEAAPSEDLPEGVRVGKDRHGRDGVWVEKARWENTLHPHHKAFQEASQIIGEPLTKDAIQLRDRAYIGQEKLYADMLSGDPATQGKVIEHFFAEAQQALADGAVGADPMVPFAESFYGTLREKSPDGYARLRSTAAKDLGDELYAEAAQMFRAGRADEASNLYRAAGHMLATIGLPYKKELEREGYLSQAGQRDETASLREQNQRLQDQLSGRTTQNQTAQFESWKADTKKAVSASVLADAIMPPLAEAETAWSKLQGGKEAFGDLVVDRMAKAVNRAIANDAAFQSRIANLNDNAKRAVSAQRRDDIRGQIVQAYERRAKLAVEANQREVLNYAAQSWKTRSDSNHKRQAAGQSQRTPTGTHTPPPRSIVPPAPARAPGGFFDADAEARRLNTLIG